MGNSDWQHLFARGLKGEALIREWLKLRGFIVLPASLIAVGGAPALEGHVKNIIASDTLAAKDGLSRWVEIKTYQRATFNQHRQRWEHGITIKHWNHYRDGQLLTGIPGYLVILQLNARLVLEGLLDEIAKTGVEMKEHYPPSGPQIFFDVRRFQPYSLDTLDERDWDFPDDVPPVTVRPWEPKKPPHPKFGWQGVLFL